MGFFLFVILVKHTYLYSTISLETLALLFTVNIKHFIQSFSSLEQLFNSFVFFPEQIIFTSTPCV